MAKKTLLCVLAAAAFLLAAYALRGAIAMALILVLVSATLAFVMTPLSKRLERHMAAGAAALLSIAAMIAVVLGVVLLIVPALFTQVGELIARVPEITAAAQSWLDGAIEYLLSAGVPDTLLNSVLERVNMLLPALLSGLENTLKGFGSFISTLGRYLLTPILAFYLLRDRKRCVDFILRLTPSKARATVMRIGAEAHRELGRYMRGQLLITATTGLSTAAGLWMAGMPMFLVMGVIMAIFNLIPFVGPFIGAVPILVFAASDGISMFFKALAVVLITQQLESSIVAPRIMSGVAHVHPVVVIVLLVSGGAAFGLLGLIFCIPAYMVLRCIAGILLEGRGAAGAVTLNAPLDRYDE